MEEIIANLNRTFESRVRLCIMSILMRNSQVDFNAFKKTLSLTDGNLASHMKALEKQEYIQVFKKFVGRKPNTTYAITNTGQRDFVNHLNALTQLVEHNKEVIKVK